MRHMRRRIHASYLHAWLHTHSRRAYIYARIRTYTHIYAHMRTYAHIRRTYIYAHICVRMICFSLGTRSILGLFYMLGLLYTYMRTNDLLFPWHQIAHPRYTIRKSRIAQGKQKVDDIYIYIYI
jgi:hypothetical protein